MMEVTAESPGRRGNRERGVSKDGARRGGGRSEGGQLRAGAGQNSNLLGLQNLLYGTKGKTDRKRGGGTGIKEKPR